MFLAHTLTYWHVSFQSSQGRGSQRKERGLGRAGGGTFGDKECVDIWERMLHASERRLHDVIGGVVMMGLVVDRF